MGKTIRANGKERGPIGTKNNRVTRPDRHRKHKPYGFTSGTGDWKDCSWKNGTDPEEYGKYAGVQNKHKARTNWKKELEQEIDGIE